MNSSQRKKIIWYFRKRLESLDYCNATFENTIDDEKQAIMDSVNNGNIKSTDPELNKAFFKLDCHILSTFRNCMIVAACTLIEDVLLQIGVNTVTDFESHVSRINEGSKIRKYLQVLENQLSVDFTPIEEDLLLIDDIIKIRNVIVHTWGKIDSCNNPVTLRDIILRRSWIQETGDGYILVEDVAYAEAITPVLNLVEHILDSVPVFGD